METDYRAVSKPSRWADSQAVDGRKRGSGKTYYYRLRRVRKEVYSQLSDGSTSLPAMQEKGTVTFAEVPMIPQQNPEIPFSFQPAVVIKTYHATVAVSNEVPTGCLPDFCRRCPMLEDAGGIRA